MDCSQEVRRVNSRRTAPRADRGRGVSPQEPSSRSSGNADVIRKTAPVVTTGGCRMRQAFLMVLLVPAAALATDPAPSMPAPPAVVAPPPALPAAVARAATPMPAPGSPPEN